MNKYPEKTKSGLIVSDFEKVIDGKHTSLYVLQNKNGAELLISNYGARIVSLIVPDKDNNWVDVVTGHNNIEEYLNSEEPYFGAVCGRTANRIAKGKFTLEGKEYTLAVNNGPNSLHGGLKGFNSVVWGATQPEQNTLILTYLAKDGEEGFPGNLQVTVTYTLTDKNEVTLKYEAKTDKTTILNLTNHAYFNLSGAGDASVADHLLTIYAEEYLPTDDTAIPYGKPEKVVGTPMDFTANQSIGSRIKDDFQQLIWARGYDHTYILNKKGEKYALAVKCYSPKTGIEMDVYTDQPGVQLYTGNWMTGNFIGKNGQRYPSQSAVCFETQHYPDSIHNPEYPSIILKPEDKFESITTFAFSVK
ncbi:aldose epimerase family protein [Dysgonomonas capnocytophagoides]|uniref:aldose epimerase family protein n=1 Tax=Dysgonomonas capnocytophagoides TaxID=45254 RepID=UPI003342B896